MTGDPRGGTSPGRRHAVFALGRFACSALAAPVWAASNASAATHDVLDAAPALMLANAWRPGLPLAGYRVSEKLDGVRGYWDGEALWTRRGGRVVCPAWFTAHWPAPAMDGELWAGRGAFDAAQSTVAVNRANDAAWRRMKFMVFDLPADPGVFDVRKEALRKLVERAAVPWLHAVDQATIATEVELQHRLAATVAAGGEGLMLHRGASPYRGVRSDDLVKLKPHDDAEARVVAYVPGQGKYAGAMGALLVEMPSGVRFKLGSGFSDADRAAPPAIGSLVTYRYRGVNKTGVPRFATFLRVALV